jgi:hypothetical protein
VESEVSTHNTTPTLDVGLSAFTVKESTLSARMEGLFPTDAQQPPASQTTRLDIEAVLSGPVGPQQTPAEVRISGTRQCRVELTLLSGPGSVTSVPQSGIMD